MLGCSRLLVSQDESPTWMHVRDVVAALFVGKRLSLGHGNSLHVLPWNPFQSGSAVKTFGIFLPAPCRDALLALSCLGLPRLGLLLLPAVSALSFLSTLGLHCVCIYPFLPSTALLKMLSFSKLDDPGVPSLEY